MLPKEEDEAKTEWMEGLKFQDVYSDRKVPFARLFRASLTEGGSHPHGNCANSHF